MMKLLLLFGALTTAVAGLNAQTTVFYETFDTSPPNSLPINWSSQCVNNGSSANTWMSADESGETNPMGFSGSVAFSNGSYSFDNLLISPAISLPVGSSTLTYKVGAYSGGFLIPNHTYNVYVLPTTSIYSSALTPTFTETITTADQAFTRSIDMSSFAGQSVKIFFRHYGTTSGQIFLLDDVKVTSSTILGTADIKSNQQVGIYPNPAKDYISIKTKSEIINTEIYDLAGRKVNDQLKTDKIDIQNLQPGNYILNVTTKEGKSSAKFIKKD